VGVDKRNPPNADYRPSGSNRIVSHIKAILILVISLMIGAATIVIHLPLNEQMLGFQIKEMENAASLVNTGCYEEQMRFEETRQKFQNLRY
jgi:hypothetical protein